MRTVQRTRVHACSPMHIHSHTDTRARSHAQSRWHLRTWHLASNCIPTHARTHARMHRFLRFVARFRRSVFRKRHWAHLALRAAASESLARRTRQRAARRNTNRSLDSMTSSRYSRRKAWATLRPPGSTGRCRRQCATRASFLAGCCALFFESDSSGLGRRASRTSWRMATSFISNST